jgi:hypothetical protein
MQEQRGRPHGPLPLYSGQRLHRGRLDRGLCDTPCFRIFRQLFQATAGLEDTNAKMGWDEIKKHVEVWSMHSEAIFLVGLVYRVDSSHSSNAASTAISVARRTMALGVV